MEEIKQVQQYWDEYTTSIQSQFTDKELGTREYFQEIKIHHDRAYHKLHSIKEAKILFEKFSKISIFLDKFPSKTNRRNGTFAQLYNNVFIPFTEIIPRALIRPFGWYIIIKAIK